MERGSPIKVLSLGVPKLLKSFFVNLGYLILEKFPKFLSIIFCNFLLFCLRRAVRFKQQPDGTYQVVENYRVHSFTSLPRGFFLYRRGLIRRGLDIAESYNITEVLFDEFDTVIDCGANNGDLWLYLNFQILASSYFAFEPSKITFRSLSKNCPNGNLVCAGLGETDGERDFFLDEEYANSSFIASKSNSPTEIVQMYSLDTFVSAHNISKIKLLKVEAEGYELEVLMGAERILCNIEYIAVDGGPERGSNGDVTIYKVIEYLAQRGFQLVIFNAETYRGLFKRTR
jgi:FkbM family methyltransferase